MIDGANVSTWIYEIARGTLTRLTFGFDNGYPIWAPDGRRIAFSSTRTGSWDLYWQASDGSGQAERLTTREYFKRPHSWSPDGKILAFSEIHPQTGTDIWTVSIGGNGKSEPFLQTEFRETRPVFSPDGLWIAYQSNESGQNEVYVRPYPSSEGKRQISIGGGSAPMWNPSGKELFYRNGDRMMVVDINTEGELTPGKPRLLFEKPSYLSRDVTPDGQRFIMIERGESQPAPTQLVLVQNWGEELKRLVPTH
jgi:serine/threonine-protein kinase